MSSRARRKKRDAVKAWKRRELAAEIARMPISKGDLRELFDWLDREDAPNCDNTLKDTIKFLNDKRLDKERIIPWLNEYGGFCDCEVLANVEDKWGED